MPVYVWEGKSRAGEKERGEMNALSEAEVQERLKKQNISPSKIKRKGSGLPFKLPGGGVPSKTIVIFTRQFATMIDAGLPLVQCLELLSDAEPHKTFKAVLLETKREIESGSTLADALGKHPTVFSPLYTNLIAAGEVAGILDTVMNRLALQLEKSMKLARKVKGAFTYPTVVSVVAVVVIIFLLYKVIPTFGKMFAEMGGGAALPKPTQIVMGMSDFIQKNIVLIIGGMVGTAIAVKVLMGYEPTRRVFDRGVLRAPIFGPIVRKSAVARFTRTLSTMVSSGVPIIDSLEIVSRTSGNYTIEDAVMYVRAKISEGENMVGPLMETGIFPSMVVQMIGVGESTGALDTMLGKIADFYEDEVDVAVENLTSLLEPLMMVFLGGAIGGMLIAMYLPIFELAGNIKAQ